MEERYDKKLTRELQLRLGEALAAVELLTPLIEKKGRQEDQLYLATLNKSLYRLIREARHGALREEEPDFHPEGLDAAELCRELCRQAETVAGSLGVGFTWQMERETLPTRGDRQLLKTAVLNMLTNAFNQSGRGGKTNLRLTSRDRRWAVTVENDGPGLEGDEPGENPLLRRPERMEPDWEAARRVARLHGGTLLQESGPEGGLRTQMILPIVALKEQAGEGELRKPTGERIDSQGGFTLLLTEMSPILPPQYFLSEDL